MAVGPFDPAAGAQLCSEFPGLGAADAALAAAVIELEEAVLECPCLQKDRCRFQQKG